MTKSDGKPCKKCGTNEWNKNYNCVQCARDRASRHYWNNKSKKVEYDRRYRQDNYDTIKERKRPTRAAIEHRRRTRKTDAGGSYTLDEWKSLLVHYGYKCLCCGRTDVKLTADHVIPVSRGGSSNIDNIQPLCGACNSRKQDRAVDYRPDSGPRRWIQRKLFD